MNVKILGDGTVGYAMKHIFEDCMDPTQDPDAVIITNHEDYVYDVIENNVCADGYDWYNNDGGWGTKSSIVLNCMTFLKPVGTLCMICC